MKEYLFRKHKGSVMLVNDMNAQMRGFETDFGIMGDKSDSAFKVIHQYLTTGDNDGVLQLEVNNNGTEETIICYLEGSKADKYHKQGMKVKR